MSQQIQKEITPHLTHSQFESVINPINTKREISARGGKFERGNAREEIGEKERRVRFITTVAKIQKKKGKANTRDFCRTVTSPQVDPNFFRIITFNH